MVEYPLDLIFHALADATRRQLLQNIKEHPTTVLKLAEPFNVSLNAISKHLKVLERAGLVIRKKKGREHHLSFNPQTLAPIDALLVELKQEWEARLEALDNFLTHPKETRMSKLIVKKLIHASPQQVFEAWSQPDMLKKWFYANKPGWKAVSANEFKVGGSYRHEMINEQGTGFLHTGTYKEIVPHKKIVFTWNSHAVQNTEVTVEFEPKGDKTEVTVTHDLLPSGDLRGKHQEGWHSCLSNLAKLFVKPNYHCSVNYDKPRAEVFRALTSEAGLKGWWTEDCTIPPLKIGSENTFRFGPTYTVMKVKEIIPNQKIVWECMQHHFLNPDFTKYDEWVGTQLIFQLEDHWSGTHLYFTQEGLTPWLECYSACENKWNYFLKESLKSYLETGVGGPHQND